MPGELVAIVAIIAGTIMVVAIARMIGAAIAAKQRSGAQQEGQGSLTQGELEAMLERVVANAQEPLVERLDMIEMMLLKQPAQLNGGPEPLLELPEAEPEGAAVPATARVSE